MNEASVAPGKTVLLVAERLVQRSSLHGVSVERNRSVYSCGRR